MSDPEEKNITSDHCAVTVVDLLRHGECADGDCFRGSRDVALSENGWQQMDRAIKNHAGPNQQQPYWQAIVTSPLVRCADFAGVLARKQQLTLQIEPELRELHFGEWEGQAVDHVWQTQAAAISAWGSDPVNHPPPGGEAADQFVQRVTGCFVKMIRARRGEKVLVVAHGGVMRALLAYCLSMPIDSMNRFDIPYGCLSRIQVIDDRSNHYYRLMSHNTGMVHRH